MDTDPEATAAPQIMKIWACQKISRTYTYIFKEHEILTVSVHYKQYTEVTGDGGMMQA
jgi:hypothetical protein